MSASKLVKSIILTAQANDSHTLVKIKSVLKWIKTGHVVRVQITGKSDRHKAMEDILKKIESEVKPGADIEQKVIKSDLIKFTLIPNKAASEIRLPARISDQKSAAKEINEIVADKDIFSKDFERELGESMRQDWRKNNKK